MDEAHHLHWSLTLVQKAVPGKGEHGVLIGRCAWHPGYRGYPLLSGIASWRGWRVRFTDGICEKCLVRFRAEHQRYLQKPARPDAAQASRAPVPNEAA
jgi:hypothetical protein